MEWLAELFRDQSVTHAVLVLSLVSSLGLMVGSLNFFGVRIGVAGVLFAGLLFGHFGISIRPDVLEFVREFGLILFVYTIGLQVGPGFFSSLRKEGLPLNLMATAIVLLGCVMAFVAWKLAGLPVPVVAGLFSGATTNTPSLGAAQQALKELGTSAPETLAYPGLAYAVAYPFGIVGVIFALGFLRRVFRVSVGDEAASLTRMSDEKAGLVTRNLVVQNPNLDGLPVKKIPGIRQSGVVISRILRGGQVSVANADTILRVGDILLAVGKADGIDEIKVSVGAESDVDIRSIPSKIVRRTLVVTRADVAGKTPRLLDLARRYQVTLSRVIRAEIEFTPADNFHFQFGDRVVAVGEEGAIHKAEQVLGNSIKLLDKPQMIPVFVGIALGVVFGSCPLWFPGVPGTVRLGLAGGPLLVAIVLSRLGHVGKLIWYMPAGANFVLRELGILLFLACVGLKSGDRFWATLSHGGGLEWIGWAMLITLVPIIVVGAFARIAYRMNYLTLSGLLAGSMTDPPALAFANNAAGSEAPSISYSTVYPLTMLLRVICAQAIVFLLS